MKNFLKSIFEKIFSKDVVAVQNETEDIITENVISNDSNAESVETENLDEVDQQFYFENKQIIELVIEKLKSEDIFAVYEKFEIKYKTQTGEIYYIKPDDIEQIEDKLAWFQTSSAENHLLRVFENDKNFNWVPITHNQSWDCDCHLLEWFEGHLIFIYKEKHDTYICSIKDGIVDKFNFHGEALERKDNVLFFETYGPEQEKTRRIQIPELIELEPVETKDLLKVNLKPKSLDPIAEKFLKHK